MIDRPTSAEGYQPPVKPAFVHPFKAPPAEKLAYDQSKAQFATDFAGWVESIPPNQAIIFTQPMSEGRAFYAAVTKYLCE